MQLAIFVNIDQYCFKQNFVRNANKKHGNIKLG